VRRGPVTDGGSPAPDLGSSSAVVPAAPGAGVGEVMAPATADDPPIRVEDGTARPTAGTDEPGALAAEGAGRQAHRDGLLYILPVVMGKVGAIRQHHPRRFVDGTVDADVGTPAPRHHRCHAGPQCPRPGQRAHVEPRQAVSRQTRQCHSPPRRSWSTHRLCLPRVNCLAAWSYSSAVDRRS